MIQHAAGTRCHRSLKASSGAFRVS
jgi:hypothetical protein